jgi:hypothetical protein
MRGSGAIAALGLALASGAAQGEANYPPTEHLWSAAQYVDFYFAHSNGNQALPHLRSAEGRALLARLTDRQNVERILSSEVAPAEKRRQIGLIVMATGAARGAYSLSLAVGEPLVEELTKVQAFNLYAIAQAARLAPAGASAPAWKTSLCDAADALSDAHLYPAAQRAALAEAIAAAWPSLGSLLTAAERDELVARLSRLGGQATEPDLRQALGRLVSAIEEAR